jgi:isoprenylcysteine carboxyl methyltransferase (ICMT) family protein YpbQ
MNTYSFAFPLAAAAAIYVFRIFELRTRRQTIRGPIRENLTLKLFMLAGTAMFAGGLLEFLLRGRQWNWATLGIGIACAVISFAVRHRAIEALGRFWSLHVEIRENHEFVRSGPFRWMRHPTYFTMILELLAVALILEAWISLTVATLVFVPTLYYRVRIEERALVEKFGDTYRQYQHTTPALIPYRLPAE